MGSPVYFLTNADGSWPKGRNWCKHFAGLYYAAVFMIPNVASRTRGGINAISPNAAYIRLVRMLKCWLNVVSTGNKTLGTFGFISLPGEYPKDVGFEVLTAVVMKSIIFWDMTPCSPLKVNWCSSEKSVDFQRTTRRYIPEESTLLSLECSWFLSVSPGMYRDRTSKETRTDFSKLVTHK
jgi:hypothetical protein